MAYPLPDTAGCAHEERSGEEKPERKLLMDINADEKCEYSEEIWKNLLEEESRKHVFHLQSPQLEFRGTLVQQLRDACRALALNVSTLHAAVALLDLFMDAHRLRADRLTHVAMACLSLAAKSEEKFGHAPTLKTLSATSGVQLCAKTFRQLEWTVAQYVRWRLLAPTPVTFAALLAHCVVSDTDLTNRHPKLLRRLKHDGAKLLEAYLDLTLSDVRLKVVDTVDVGCACVACARADLGLCAWPPWLVTLTTRKPASVAPIARLLQRMMHIKSRESCGASVPKTLCASLPLRSPSSESDTYCRRRRNRRVSQDESEEGSSPDSTESVLDLSDDPAPMPPNVLAECFKLPSAADVALQRVNTPAEYRFSLSNRLMEASLEPEPSTSGAAVKRGLDSSVELDVKRYRLTAQTSQLCLCPPLVLPYPKRYGEAFMLLHRQELALKYYDDDLLRGPKTMVFQQLLNALELQTAANLDLYYPDVHP